MRFGKQTTFQIIYEHIKGELQTVELPSVSYNQYQTKQAKRHSTPFDYLNYASQELLEKRNEVYYSKILNDSTATLVVNSFAILPR